MVVVFSPELWSIILAFKVALEQVRKLAEFIGTRGTPATALSFPDRSTPIGALISSYLKGESELDDAAVHLLFAANRWEKAQLIRTKLDSGETVIADRYAYSGAAFTAAKGKQSLDWCKSPDRGLPRPDAIIYLDIKPEVAKRRGDYGAERYEDEVFQEKVQRQLDTLRAEEPEGWEVVDADKTEDEVAAEIQGIAARTMAKVALLPLKELWVKEDPVAAMSFGFGGMGFGRTSS